MGAGRGHREGGSRGPRPGDDAPAELTRDPIVAGSAPSPPRRASRQSFSPNEHSLQTSTNT